MATHSSVLAWRIPGTEEPGRRPSKGLHRVGHDSSDLATGAAVLGLHCCTGLSLVLRSRAFSGLASLAVDQGL